MIAATLQRCCSDVLRLLATPGRKGTNEEGFSETIHLRHLAAGHIPVALAFFPVLLTRLQVDPILLSLSLSLCSTVSIISVPVGSGGAGSAKRWVAHLQSRVRPPVL